MKIISYLLAGTFGSFLSYCEIDILSYKGLVLLSLFITFGANEAWRMVRRV